MAQLTIAEDEDRLAQLAAERLTVLIESAVADRDVAVVSLTGGTTPRRLYSCLADPSSPWRDRIPWTKVHLFWGDERHVPPDHPDSNYRMAKESILAHVPIPSSHVHRIRGEMPDARDAATDYERELADVVSGLSRKEIFDVMLLGLGEDAHIASIFPGSELLRDSPGRAFVGRRVAAVWVTHFNAWRITLTPSVLLDSRTIVMLVSGEKKAAAVHAAIEAPLDLSQVPAHLLRGADDRVEWLLDRAASSRV